MAQVLVRQLDNKIGGIAEAGQRAWPVIAIRG